MTTESTAKLSVAVAEEIRVWMTRRRLSGERLAKELDVSPAWVSYRINGQVDIKLGELERIAEALDVEVAELLPAPATTRTRPGDGLTRRSAHANVRPRSTSLLQSTHAHERSTPTSSERTADYADTTVDLRESRRPVRLCGGSAR